MEAYKDRLLTFYTDIINKYNALSLREQWIVLVAIVAVVFLMWQIILSGSVKELNKAKGQVATIKAQFMENEQQVAVYTASMLEIEKGEGDKEIDKEFNSLHKTEDKLNTIINKIADPQSLMAVTRTLLDDDNKIDVQHIVTKPLKTEIDIIEGDAEGDHETAPKVYKHSIHLKLKGSYFDVMDYFSKLDSMPFTVFYDNVTLDANSYPANKVGITLYTVTLDKEWGQEINK